MSPTRTGVRAAVAAFLTFFALLAGTAGTASAQTACAAGQYTYNFANYCPFPVWTAQTAAASNNTSFPPVGGNWAVAGRCTSNAACSSGACDLNSGQCTCGTSSDCAGGATCQQDGKCSTTQTFCMPQAWTSGTFWPRTGCTVPSTGNLDCDTGQCTASGAMNGLLDCGVGITSPTNPVTQFEVTSTAGSSNYDVSLVAGANVEMNVTPVGGSYFLPGVPAGQNAVACYVSGCTANLIASCPAALQETSGGKVIGCLDPCTQCQRAAPNGSDPNPTIYSALMCSSTIATDISGNAPAPTLTCGGAAGGLPTYQDMYCVQNFADPVPNAQASSNQGTATAFSQDDCFPGLTFVVPTWPVGYTPPSGVGVCLYASPPQNTIPGFNDYGWFNYPTNSTLSCGNLADGTACGGYLTGQADAGLGTATYASGLGYTCRTVSYLDTTSAQQTAHLCLPPTTSGLGTCTYDTLGQKPLYTATGGVMNAAWLTAGLQAGGGTVPYYATFKSSCAAAYTWQYDDASSGFACNAAAVPNGAAFSGFNVTYCGSQAQAGAASGAPASVLAFTGTGKAEGVGRATTTGAVRVSGRFTPLEAIALNRASLRLTDLLDEVGAAGELTGGTRGARYLPRVLHASAQSTPVNAVYESPDGATPDIKVTIANVAGQPSALAFTITAERTTIAVPTRCERLGRGTTKLETAFELEIDGNVTRVGSIKSWHCRGEELRMLP